MIEKFKLPLGLSLVGLVLILGGVFSSNIIKSSPKQFPKESLISTSLVSVDIAGAVKNPGVYKLEEGSRIAQGVDKAGGFSDQADQEYISKYINLAQKLIDGSKVYIPKIGEQMPVTTTTVMGVSAFQSKLNINTSSQSELESLPGIGPVTASKIISDRPYQDIAELLSKKIVSKAVFEKIKDSLVVY